MYVNGEWVTLAARVEVQNPATLEIIGSVPDASAKEARQAVDAA